MTADKTLRVQLVQEAADSEGVCRRPQVMSVVDRVTGEDRTIGIPCGCTQASKCPGCAKKAQRIRMHQCREGWHLDHEPEREPVTVENPTVGPSRRVRSTKRRQDVPNLPQVPMEDRTLGTTFYAPDGREYRPSMFVTLTLPSYGKITPGTGTPENPWSYDYRRAALDALFFPKLVDQFWKALRRCAGYDVQYFSAIEPQKRLAPHLHAAIRGALPREVIRQVVRAVYVQIWWPRFDRMVYGQDELPVWTGDGYADATTGAMLPTWDEAIDALDADPYARPAHIMRFGRQTDIKGITAGTPDADRAVRYLVKYLNKSIAEPFTDPHVVDTAYEAHIDRLHQELRWLPCSEQCANWLRYGVQPAGAKEGMMPGACPKKHHDREHLGLGGRRCLVSRKWTGKTLKRHKADRAQVVKEALLAYGYVTPEIERMAADVLADDGKPRFVWQPKRVAPPAYSMVIMRGIQEKRAWLRDYSTAKEHREIYARAAARKLQSNVPVLTYPDRNSATPP